MRSYRQYCSVARALDVVGDRWTLLIVRELLLQGACRYTDLQHGLPGIATNLLSERLKDLEGHGLIARRAASPPVATTLYELTDTGRQLEPALQALGRFGVQYMPAPTGDEAFRSHWLAWPVSVLLRDADPDAPAVTIEVRTGDEPAVIEVCEGRIDTHLGSAPSPDLILEGGAPAILVFLTGLLSLHEAQKLGLRTEGSEVVLVPLQWN